MKKNILIFSTAYYPFVAGAEVAIREITDRLAARYSFDLITARFDRALPAVETVGLVTVYRVGIGMPLFDKLILPFVGAYHAWRLNARREYMCLWGVMATYATGAGFILNIVREMFGRKKIPMVLTLQEGDSEEHIQYKWGGLISLSWKMALRRTDTLTALSTFLLHKAERMGYAGRRVLVPNGVTVRHFSARVSKKDRESLAASLGKKPGDVFLVTVSRLVKKNGIDDIIRSLSLLSRHISLLIIGEGIEGERLKELARAIGVRDRVLFAGFVPHDDLPRYLSVCDIFVRPSRSEGFGNSFIEAMAARLPVIATPVGGIPDFLDDKQTGVFCSPDNPASIAQSVKMLLEDSDLRQRITLAAHTRVVERYDWNRIAKIMDKEVFSLFS